MILPIPLDTLHRAKAGDADAFEQLMRNHERQVLQTAVRITGSLADGQDVAQDVFVKLHRELPNLHDLAEVGPWLHRVTVNACLDALRKRKRDPLMQAVPNSWRSHATTPDKDVELQEEKQMVLAALKVLTAGERSAIVLRELEGLTTGEAAKALGIAESTVRVQIASARLKLRRFFEGARK